MKLSSRRARVAAAGALALVIGVPVSLGATGLAAKVVGSSDTTPTATEYPASKVTICHHTHSQTNPFVTITVSQNALPAHLGHGDTVGPCSPTAAPAAPAVSQTLKHAHKAKHSAGKSSLHRQHGKLSKSVKVKTHGKSGATHGHAITPTTAVHGKGHLKTHGQQPVHAKTHGKAHANGHGSAQGHGQSGQVHGQGHGQGQGSVQGHGQAGTHGNGNGNGNGNGH